jgi:hypothetical protein
VSAVQRDLPFAAVVAVVAVGLFLVTVLDRWRFGSGVIGLGLCLAAALRLTLAVRSRAVDAAVLLTLGFGLVILANSIPTSP